MVLIYERLAYLFRQAHFGELKPCLMKKKLPVPCKGIWAVISRLSADFHELSQGLRSVPPKYAILVDI